MRNFLCAVVVMSGFVLATSEGDWVPAVNLAGMALMVIGFHFANGRE